MVRNRRSVASTRVPMLSSSGSTTAAGVAASAPSISTTGRVAPLSSTSQCWPSAARSEKLGVSAPMEPASGKFAGAGATTTVVGLRPGSHTTLAWSARRPGSAAKSQPPALGEWVGEFRACLGFASYRSIGLLIVGIASQKFPRERLGAEVIEKRAGFCGLPVIFLGHLSSSPSDALVMHPFCVLNYKQTIDCTATRRRTVDRQSQLTLFS